jgi:hypothetical protein
MKKSIYYLLIFICLIFTACDNWLDIQPKAEFKRDKMFETENGFQSALTGIYIKLKGSNVYGGNLTMTTIEHLALHWESLPESTEIALNEHDYKHANVKYTMAVIYGELYNIIVNVNAILEQIDAKQNIFSDGMYELIKGEALAVRAYCHFEILRLFGPVPTNVNTTINLPYVTTLSKNPHTQYSYDQFTQFLLKDLTDAENLLNEVDPIKDYEIEDLNRPNSGKYKPENTFWAYRKFRMNYYSVLGLKARFYLWTQDKANAYTYAKMIIDATNEDGSPKFILGQSIDITNDRFTLGSEHIFSLNVYNLLETSDLLFGERATLTKDKTLILRDVFENNLADIRYGGLWTEVSSGAGDRKFVIKKYWQNENNQISDKKVIPLMRLYEMYLIAMECGSLAESNTMYAKLSEARNNLSYEFTDETDRLNVIIQEYRREFYAEGLMFYTYKRLAIENILWSGTIATEETYIVPLPDTEIITN